MVTFLTWTIIGSIILNANCMFQEDFPYILDDILDKFFPLEHK